MGVVTIAPTNTADYYLRNSSLTSTDDLDDLKTNGLYYISSNTPANSPASSAFLRVESTGGIVIQSVQKQWTLHSRFYSNGTWKEWKSVTMS